MFIVTEKIVREVTELKPGEPGDSIGTMVDELLADYATNGVACHRIEVGFEPETWQQFAANLRDKASKHYDAARDNGYEPPVKPEKATKSEKLY